MTCMRVHQTRANMYIKIEVFITINMKYYNTAV